MDYLTQEVAEEEAKKWISHKGIELSDDEEDQNKFKNLVKFFRNGTFELDQENMTITHNLKFPIGEDGQIDTLTYKPRIKVGQLNNKLKGVKATDTDGRLVGYIAALSEKPTELIKQLDTVDNSASQSVVMFFL